MKDRILKGWTFIRWTYLAMGLLIVIQAVVSQKWMEFFLGAYFASMGIFAFGCASGNCIGGSCAREPERETINEQKQN